MPSHITPILQEILDAVIARAAECELPGWCRTGIVSGTAWAWDVCCECSDGSGQLSVRLVGMEPDPDTTRRFGGCDDPILLTVAVGSLRCVPTQDEYFNPPSAEEDQASAELILWDAEVIKDAVMCNIDERLWQQWRTLDNLGGCGGGEHTFQIPFGGCHCSDCTESPVESS